MRLVDYQGKTWTVKPFEFTDKPVPGGSVAPLGDATVADVNGFLQAAIDLAWEIGLRPAGYSDPATELTAVRYVYTIGSAANQEAYFAHMKRFIDVHRQHAPAHHAEILIELERVERWRKNGLPDADCPSLEAIEAR